MDRLIDTRCTTGNRKAMIHYLISFPPCNSQPPYINVLSASSFLGIHYTIVIPFFPFFFLFLSNSRRKFFRIITQKKGKSNKFRNLVQVQTTSRRNAIDAGFIYQKIHFFSLFFLALSRSAFEMMMEKEKEKRSIILASNPARNRKEEKELKINLFKKGRKTF